MNAARQKPTPLTHAVLAMVDAYMLAHLDEPLHLADLARVAHRSVRYFANGYALATGETAYAVMTRHRLARAAWLLSHTTLPLAAVGRMTGSADSSSFGAKFKKHYGLTPRGYRLQAHEPGPSDGLHAVCLRYPEASPTVQAQVLRLLGVG